MEAGLWLVSTPIGNLRDMTLRALDVLAAAQMVLAEDTRVSARLLAAYGLRAPLRRCDDHAAPAVAAEAVEAVRGGAVVALVTDAGTPLVSDPGFVVARAMIAEGLPVFAAPGASSLLAALTVAGLPADRVTFAGFLPPKSGARKTAPGELAGQPGTLVLFESGPRLRDSLTDMAEVLGDRPAAVCRELTKLHETVIRATLPELATDDRLDAPKGEIVVVIGPGEAKAGADDPASIDAALTEALTRLAPGPAAAEVARELGLPRKPLYARALELKGR